MGWFLYAISLIWVGIGTAIILYTEHTRKILPQLVAGHNRKIIGIIAAVVGVFLLLSASLTRHEGIVTLLGLLALAKGVFVFLNPKNLYDRVIDWYLNSASDQTFRLMGIITLVLGTVLLSWII